MMIKFLIAHIGLLYELLAVFLILGFIIFLCALVIARLDQVRLDDAIYFAFITAFTVGLGDVTPRTRGARVITVLLAFLGLILVGILVAVAVHALNIAIRVQ